MRYNTSRTCPIMTIGKAVGNTVFSRGDLIRTWNEYDWKYYKCNGIEGKDLVVGLSHGVNYYLSAQLTDYQINDDASIPNPYINTPCDSWGEALIFWNDVECVGASTIEIQLPEKLNICSAWYFLQQLPTWHQNNKIRNALLSIRKRVKRSFISDYDKKLLSYTEYVLLPNKTIDSSGKKGYLSSCDNIFCIKAVHNFDNLFQLCTLPPGWKKVGLNITDDSEELKFTIEHEPRKKAILHIH